MNLRIRNKMIILLISAAFFSLSQAQIQSELVNPTHQIKNQFLLKSTQDSNDDYLPASESSGFTERLMEAWDGINWLPISRSLLFYNSNNDITEFKNQIWVNSQWSNKCRYIYNYQDTLLIEEISQNWDRTKFVDEMKIIYAYDVHGYESSKTFLLFNDKVWNKMTKYQNYIDNSTHLIDSILVQTWEDSSWKNSLNYVWIKNKNLRDSIVYNYWWRRNGWENGYRHLYSYEDSKTSYVLSHDYWNMTNYVSSSREYMYNDESGKYLYSYGQYWDGKWRNEYKSIASYNYSGKIIELLNKGSDALGLIWVNNSRDLYSYNSDNKIIIQNHQIWDGINWADESRYLYSYGTTSEVVDKSSLNSFTLHDNYPNPFNPKTTIQFSIAVRNYVSLKVFDILGNEIATLIDGNREAGTYSVEFFGNSLGSGLYVFRLTAGNFSKSKKMLLIK